MTEDKQQSRQEPFGTVAFYRNNVTQFYPSGQLPYLDNALDYTIVYKDPVTIDTKHLAYNYGYTDGREKGYIDGVKAFFDNLLTRAANNWHANSAVAEMCKKENNLIYDWAKEALLELAEPIYSEWVQITELQSQIQTLKVENAKLKSNGAS